MYGDIEFLIFYVLRQAPELQLSTIIEKVIELNDLVHTSSHFSDRLGVLTNKKADLAFRVDFFERRGDWRAQNDIAKAVSTDDENFAG